MWAGRGATKVRRTRSRACRACALVVAALTATATPFVAAPAQRVAPAAVTRAWQSAEPSRPPSFSRDAQGQTTTTPASASGYAVNGALIGAAVGGVAGLVADRADHSGEGLIAPVMIAAGALAGAAVGAVVGALLGLGLSHR